MTPRPIHKWITFWLGLFVACFLAWAWRDSYRHHTTLSIIRIDWFGGDWGAQATRAYGKTFLEIYPSWLRDHRIDLLRDPLPSAPDYDTATYHPEMPFASSIIPDWKIIPDYLLFFSFLLLWSAWLAWRWRRQCTLTKSP